MEGTILTISPTTPVSSGSCAYHQNQQWMHTRRVDAMKRNNAQTKKHLNLLNQRQYSNKITTPTLTAKNNNNSFNKLTINFFLILKILWYFDISFSRYTSTVILFAHFVETTMPIMEHLRFFFSSAVVIISWISRWYSVSTSTPCFLSLTAWSTLGSYLSELKYLTFWRKFKY